MPVVGVRRYTASYEVRGFIAPGHVCTVVGCQEYEDLVRDF